MIRLFYCLKVSIGYSLMLTVIFIVMEITKYFD